MAHIDPLPGGMLAHIHLNLPYILPILGVTLLTTWQQGVHMSRVYIIREPRRPLPGCPEEHPESLRRRYPAELQEERNASVRLQTSSRDSGGLDRPNPQVLYLVATEMPPMRPDA